jgi:hypothetical protein
VDVGGELSDFVLDFGQTARGCGGQVGRCVGHEPVPEGYCLNIHYFSFLFNKTSELGPFAGHDRSVN